MVVLPNPNDLRPLPITSLHDRSMTDFNLFLEVGGILVLYAPSLYQWHQHELMRLNGEGHKNFFYAKDDESKVRAYQDISLIPSVDETLPPDQRLSQITDVAAEFTRVLFNHDLNEAAMFRGQQIAESLVRCIEEDLTCVSALGLLANHDHYTYYHSGRVAAYSTAIAMQLGLNDSYCLTQLSMGCLLHDIGKTKIDATLLNKSSQLTDAERHILRQHPTIGAALTRDSILTAVPKDIILYHHERLDGSGYPEGLSDRQLLEEVKIASFADVFDALTTNRPYQRRRSRFEALDYMRFNLLHNLHQDSYKALVEILNRSKLAS